MNVSVFLKKMLKNATFDRPKHAQIAIFDAAGADTIAKYVIKDRFTWGIVPTRFEKTYFHPDILLRWILLLVRLVFKSLWGKHALRKSDVLLCYYWALLDLISPDIVVTFIDTVSPFYKLSRTMKERTFIAIQNGNRWHLVDSMPTVDIPHFFCFGEYEVRKYQEHGHKVDHYYPIGSIKGNYAGATTSDPIYHGLTYDICLVSQWRDQTMLTGANPEYGTTMRVLYDYMERFLRESGKKAVIACAVSSEAELNYFRTKFDKLADIFKNDPKTLSTYRLMQAADVVVTNFSTAGVEALGWGKKVLFCNFSSNKKIGFPVESLWSLQGGDYESFKNSISDLLKSSELPDAKKVRREFMNYPVGSTAGDVIHFAISKILEQIKDNPAQSEKVRVSSERLMLS